MINRAKMRKGFTLIELLVVIAIIAILAAILFPVFAQVREKARQASCQSNCKQFSMAILQYVGDFDEAMPLTYKDDHMYGPDIAQYNTTIDGGNKTQTGVPNEIMPYIKSTQVFTCPSDRPVINSGNGGSFEMDTSKTVPLGAVACATAATSCTTGHLYSGIYGTSYKFTNQSYSKGSDPVPGTGPYINNTGYDAMKGCATATSTKCVFFANTTGTIDYVNAVYVGGTPNPGTGYALVTLADFARPAETRIMGDWVKSYQGIPASFPPGFHKNGSTIGFADGHVKFYVNKSEYQKGCDGVDWSWDTPGTCNPKGYQRQAD